MIVTADVGPRIVHFGFVGSDNELAEVAAERGQTGGDQWHLYGGHRLWHAPEVLARTYVPDNAPVAVEAHAHFVRFIQPIEPGTGIQKEIDIRLEPRTAQVQVTHRLHNRGLWAIELAAWALTMLAPGGTAIIPLPPRGPHPENLQPTGRLILWPYTDLADLRWTWGRHYVLLRQDPAQSAPQKIGVLVPNGWAAYARAGHLFVKTFAHFPNARYPDLGCSVETFTNATMLELETLGPLTRLEPGAALEHIENWFLFRGVPVPANEAEVNIHLTPKINWINFHKP
jgi:hypothetical protein